MKKNQTFIFFLLAIFLIGSVNAFIEDSWIDPSEPTCSEGITVCAEINSTSLDYVKISCTAGSKTFTEPNVIGNGNLYCLYLSNKTLGVYDGLEVNCIIESNEGEIPFYETENVTYSCPECGNNILETGEECDLGLANGIACSPSYGSSCNYCSLSCSNIIIEGPYCGDGTWQLGYEECDDGNLINGDGCDNECQEEPCDKDCKSGSPGTWRFTSLCEPNWKCSGWSECSNNAMTRTCYDSNNCAYSYNRPVEKSGCDELPASQVFVDGKAVKTVNYSLILFVLTFLLLIILIILLATRKKK